MSDNIVPLFGIIFLFGAPVAAWIISRVLAHQERMEMLRRGFVPPTDPRLLRRAAKMGWQPGAMPPGAPYMGGVPNMAPGAGGYPEFNYYAQAQMRKGITVTLVGLALLIGLSFIGSRGDGSFVFGPWLLGGLIPMFVGIAQVINATLNGARLPGLSNNAQSNSNTMGTSGFGPRPSAGPPPPEPPAAPYAGWRPGSTPEIEKPAPPPDVR